MVGKPGEVAVTATAEADQHMHPGGILLRDLSIRVVQHMFTTIMQRGSDQTPSKIRSGCHNGSRA
ncbi:hypothetical protein E1295_10000 [Nonomuraea mesophila]|uniref:Uncharacterized protein n=1 Tax=Nonomuraea mesophila TaxID=2530382 RepID=A0A4R5FT79_9ACTN|nr:hypothetical protein [Nonomuraea mesophila]TDE56720.1 hypothetical protein E1295_10000 [Nonomuraea mesophila]